MNTFDLHSPRGRNEGAAAHSFVIVSAGFAGTVTLHPPVTELCRVEVGSETSSANGREHCDD